MAGKPIEESDHMSSERQGRVRGARPILSALRIRRRGTKPARSLVDSVLHGAASLNDIDRFVAAWHRGNDPRAISEFLGFTTAEYARWVQHPDTLPSLLKARLRATHSKRVRRDAVAA